MDNPLTPNKIQRLMHYAEDRSFNLTRRLVLTEDNAKCTLVNQAQISKSTVNCESSSGILDLDQIEVFGDSEGDNESLCKSTAFHPGEMTGRSTGTEENCRPIPMGRHSLALSTITNEMDKQTDEVHEVMRHSISNATAYSFHSKRDLSADEASLVMREAPLPILPSNIQNHFVDTISMNHSDLSVGAYFQTRCPDFGKILEKTDSPDRSVYSAMPSITEVSSSTTPRSQHAPKPHLVYQLDESLDCVPVRQSRHEKPEKMNFNNPGIGKNYEKQSFHSATNRVDKNKDTYSKAAENYSAFASTSKPTELQKNRFPMLTPIASSSFVSKSFKAPSSKPTDSLIKHMQASLRLMSEDTEGSAAENSLSISKIADYLGKESNVSVSAILKYNNFQRPQPKKQPLTELQVNLQENKNNEEMLVTNLRDTRNMDTASTAGTVNTVISLDNFKIPEDGNVPSVVVTSEVEEGDKKRSTRSKSPSSKSRSTLSTVQENCNSFKSADSPLHSNKGDVNNTHVPSPNIVYKELDKSVDWQDILQQKRHKQDGLAKEKWADIVSSDGSGFVGTGCAVNIKVTTLTDSWLTAKIIFDTLPNNGKDITIELPRLPLLLSPGKTEQFTFHITSNVEMDTTLSYSVLLRDASVEVEIEQKETLKVHFKMPTIQAMSSDGVNKMTFPPIQENLAIIKSFVLISDCPIDLQLDLSVVEGDNVFTIKCVQEIRKSEVNKVLLDRDGTQLEEQPGKQKNKGMNKQFCRLTNGNAISVTIKFNAPPLSVPPVGKHVVTFSGALTVNLIGVNTLLKKVELLGRVGIANLNFKVPMPGQRLMLTNERTDLLVYNDGTVPGVWAWKNADSSNESLPFKVWSPKLVLLADSIKQLSLSYTGPEDTLTEASLVFEEVSTGRKVALEVTGGKDQPKYFPIKTNATNISFVRAGRKEISLKNSSNKKIYLRCHVIGEGFSIDMPGMELRGVFCLPFGPLECRTLPILFSPVSNIPHSATLHLVFDKTSNFSRKIRLFGCSSGSCVRWSGLVTYGDTALVRAESRAPLALQLYNKSAAPAFLCATLHFNLQYQSVASTAQLVGGQRVIPGRTRHSLTLSVEWARVERRAREAATAALATVIVLTGAELTRRRILKVLRDESSSDVPDTSLLDEHLQVLAAPFEGEDPNMDNMLKDFQETKASLQELIGGLNELTAQIVLPQDFADENTIIITDDTVVEHHTLCD